MKTDWLVKDKQFYKTLFSLALPLAGQSILTYSVALADNMMVGQIGDLALSSVYMANQWYTLLLKFVAGFTSAGVILSAQYWGKKDTDSIKTIISMTTKFCLVTGLVFFALAFFMPEKLMGMYTNDEEVQRTAAEYLKIVSFSYLFYSVTQTLMGAMQCVETVNISMYTSMASLLVNVVLNYVLIFGHLGFPAMGIRGAAVATLCCRILETAIMTWYVVRRDQKLRLRLSDLKRFNKLLLKDYFVYGIPIFAGSAMWGVNLTMQNGIIGRLGQTAISAVSISNNLFDFISVGVYGVARATGIVIGKTVGSGDYELVKKYAKTLQLVFVLMGLGTSVIMYLSHFLIPVLYPGESAATLETAKQLVYVLSVMVIGTAYQMSCLTGIVRAGGCTYFVFVNDTIFIWCVLIPLGLLSAFVWKAPVWVVFACLKCDQLLKCIVAAVKVNRFHWMKNITREVQK